jgi:hypothetical protein
LFVDHLVLILVLFFAVLLQLLLFLLLLLLFLLFLLNGLLAVVAFRRRELCSGFRKVLGRHEGLDEAVVRSGAAPRLYAVLVGSDAVEVYSLQPAAEAVDVLGRLCSALTESSRGQRIDEPRESLLADGKLVGSGLRRLGRGGH